MISELLLALAASLLIWTTAGVLCGFPSSFIAPLQASHLLLLNPPVAPGPALQVQSVPSTMCTGEALEVCFSHSSARAPPARLHILHFPEPPDYPVPSRITDLPFVWASACPIYICDTSLSISLHCLVTSL